MSARGREKVEKNFPAMSQARIIAFIPREIDVAWNLFTMKIFATAQLENRGRLASGWNRSENFSPDNRGHKFSAQSFATILNEYLCCDVL